MLFLFHVCLYNFISNKCRYLKVAVRSSLSKYENPNNPHRDEVGVPDGLCLCWAAVFPRKFHQDFSL